VKATRRLLWGAVLCLCPIFSGPVEATIIWGVTGSHVDNPIAQAEVFKVDTVSWTLTKLHTTAAGTNFSDIAVTPSGRVYAIGSDYNHVDGEYFKDFFQLDPEDGQVTNSWHGVNPRDQTINGLTAESDTSLLAVEGGSSGQTTPHLIRINLDAAGGYVDADDLGEIDTTPGLSDGDIVRSPDGSYFIAALGGGDDLYEIEPTDPSSASHMITVLGLPQIAGLAYDFDAAVGSAPYNFGGAASPALLAGVFQDGKKLYDVNTSTGAMTEVFDLTGHLDWNVFGLDSVPEPTTLVLLLLGATLIGAKRRK